MFMQHHNDTMNNRRTQWQRRRKTSLTIFTSHFICKGTKRVTQGLRVGGSWWPNRNCNILTPTLMAVNVVFLVLQGCSTGGPGAHSAGWWLSLLHLINIFSGPQLIRAPSPFGLVWLSLPHIVWNCLGLNSTGFRSIRRPYITFKLPRGDMDTPPQFLPISSD